MRKPWTLTLIVAGAALLLPLAAPAAASNYRMETAIERSFDLSSGRLTVDVGDADVQVRSGGSGGVDVTVRYGGSDMDKARERFESMEFEVEQSGDGVVVRSSRRNRANWQIGWSRGRFEIQVVVQVPDGFEIDARTGDGDVQVSDLRGEVKVATGDGDVGLDSVEGAVLRVATGDGDINLDDVRADELSVRTGDGDIQANSLDVGSVEIRTGDGDVDLRQISGRFEVETGDGDIFASFLHLDRSSFATSDGDISIRADSGAELDLRGEEVSIRGSFRGEKGEEYAQGAVDGGGPTITARTGDGTISFRGSGSGG